MNRFQHDNKVLSAQLPNEFSESFAPALSQLHSSQCDVVGSLADTILSSDQAENVSTPNSQWTITSDTVVSSYRSKYFINSTSRDYLQVLYSKLYNSPLSSVEVPSACWKYSSVNIRGKQIGCYKSRSHSSSIILALWKADLFGQPSLLGVDKVE